MEIIAEIGQNHNGDMDLARDLIREAKARGANVAKFQLYDARALFPKEGNEWFDYNCQTELSRDELTLLAESCEHEGIEFMASVFDVERIDWLEALGVKRYKIASRSINETAIIDALCETGKPLIASLGMWQGSGFPDIRAPGGIEYLYCISKYPTPLENVKLQAVDFTSYGGFSDHTIGCAAAMAALSRGAQIIEKHFTLDQSAYGPDHACSMTPDELGTLSRFRDELTTLL